MSLSFSYKAEKDVSMDLIQVRKEIEEKAKGHRKPGIPPVYIADFEGLSGKEFLDKAYCRLLGRLPVVEEKEQLYRRFYSGDVSKWEILEGIAVSEEAELYGANRVDVILGYRELKKKEGRKSTFRGKTKRILSLLRYLFSHKKAWRRLERVQEIWEQEDKI